jgi:hypothetical protein
MKTLNDRDAVIGAWLEDGPATLPSETRQAISVGIRAVSRRRPGVRGRFGIDRIGLPRLAAAMGGAGVVVTAALAVSLYANLAGGVGAEHRSPDVAMSGAMWPQLSLDEVREAQKLADAGDPRYTWQVDPELRSGFGQPSDDTEIVARFLRQELGWDDFRFMPIPEDGFGNGASYNNAYIRCAAGGTTTMYADDPRGSGCDPTIDDVRYERVSIDLGQLVRQDPTGIWVVTGWRALEPFEQVVPPTDVEAARFLEAFLQARLDGEGAEQYVDVPADENMTGQIPLLYATTQGVHYERYESEIVEGPVWPDGWLRIKVRLATHDDQTVVEQTFFIVRDGGALRLEYRSRGLDAAPTTEDGNAVPAHYSFLDGGVRFRAPWPWEILPEATSTTLGLDTNGRGVPLNLSLIADPRPVERGCKPGPAPSDAAAMAGSIGSDPDLEATTPVPVTLGGASALWMDIVTAPGADACEPVGVPQVISQHIGLPGSDRMRLYLVDLPEASNRILAIVLTAEASEFVRGIEGAEPILETFAFETR